MYLIEALNIPKNTENIHGESYIQIEAPHDFSLNFWKNLTWFQKWN